MVTSYFHRPLYPLRISHFTLPCRWLVAAVRIFLTSQMYAPPIFYLDAISNPDSYRAAGLSAFMREFYERKRERESALTDKR